MKSNNDNMRDIARMTNILYELSEEERQQLKQVLLEIYQDILDFCNKEKLCVMLGGGSALGAVRHGGFIPWDDDLDLMMPRKDYDYFFKEFPKNYGDKYTLYVPQKGHKMSNLFGKVIKKNTELVELQKITSDFDKGIYIDIFPIEYAPNNSIAQKVKGTLSIIFGLAAVSIFGYQFRNSLTDEYMKKNNRAYFIHKVRLFLGMLFSFRSYEYWYIKFDKFVRTKRTTNYITVPTGRKRYLGELYKKEVFFPVEPVEFEGKEAYIPGDYNKYLIGLYGDYMKIPPVEKRERHYFISFKI
ncbi:LicD family protein [Neobacillus ginsengisoli]|uniref:Lipopolysaccharide cholinephosphotransferase n=1 Tax=Neobacillus ginsengisoli TaxID=904295 RepID=A0ABT9Y0T8_9BACI|nr:LicD family protein [Neobacillus ginsengisoli]MDQ0200744.1 lipopolysaccharide cholinephosphotransferase [Neobacillus ginsengisoli]